MHRSHRFSFKPVVKSQRELVHRWLVQPHISEWLHGDGLKNTFEWLDDFFKGVSPANYWIAYDHDTPFGFLITFEIRKEHPDDADLAHWCQEKGTAVTLDLFICDVHYLGKGLAVPMIQEFLISQFPHATEVFIDPEASNTRAVHVYQKAGFKTIGTFIASWHPVPHLKMRLSMQDLLPPII